MWNVGRRSKENNMIIVRNERPQVWAYLQQPSGVFCINYSTSLLFLKGKFSKKPSVFITAAHHHADLKRDAASIWMEDISQSSFNICLRELQNYAGSHEDIYVVSALICLLFVYFTLNHTSSLAFGNPLHFFVRSNARRSPCEKIYIEGKWKR